MLRLLVIDQVDESEQLSKMATVYLPDIFPNLKVQRPPQFWCKLSWCLNHENLSRVYKLVWSGSFLINTILRGLQIKDVVELSLSANQKKSHMKKLTWTVEGNEKVQKNILRGRPLGRDDTSVEIAPMEIRTFLITLWRKKSMGYSLTLWSMLISPCSSSCDLFNPWCETPSVNF